MQKERVFLAGPHLSVVRGLHHFEKGGCAGGNHADSRLRERNRPSLRSLYVATGALRGTEHKRPVCDQRCFVLKPMAQCATRGLRRFARQRQQGDGLCVATPVLPKLKIPRSALYLASLCCFVLTRKEPSQCLMESARVFIISPAF